MANDRMRGFDALQDFKRKLGRDITNILEQEEVKPEKKEVKEKLTATGIPSSASSMVGNYRTELSIGSDVTDKEIWNALEQTRGMNPEDVLESLRIILKLPDEDPNPPKDEEAPDDELPDELEIEARVPQNGDRFWSPTRKKYGALEILENDIGAPEYRNGLSKVIRPIEELEWDETKTAWVATLLPVEKEEETAKATRNADTFNVTGIDLKKELAEFEVTLFEPNQGQSKGPLNVIKASNTLMIVDEQVPTDLEMNVAEDVLPFAKRILRYAEIMHPKKIPDLIKNIERSTAREVQALAETYDANYGGSPDNYSPIVEIQKEMTAILNDPLNKKMLQQFEQKGVAFLKLADDVSKAVKSDVIISKLTTSEYQTAASTAIKELMVLKQAIINLGASFGSTDNISVDFGVPNSMKSLLNILKQVTSYQRVSERKEQHDHQHFKELSDKNAMLERKLNIAEAQISIAVREALSGVVRTRALPSSELQHFWIYSTSANKFLAAERVTQLVGETTNKPLIAVQNLIWTDFAGEALKFNRSSKAVEFVSKVMAILARQGIDTIKDTHLDDLTVVTSAIELPPLSYIAKEQQ